MQLLRTILIIVIAYYLIKLIFRYVVPLLARYFIRKSQKNFEEQTRQQKKRGEMHINYTPNQKKKKDELGEYVDYEEVDE
jgi:hypothetical protein